MDNITLKILKEAIAGRAAAFRTRITLLPAGGEGDKVFPPTYAGAVYATEERRVKNPETGEWQSIPCVLLDSVQSQANRLEEALQRAFDNGRLKLPIIRVDFSKANLLDEVGSITSLEAPHRASDAILRDSLLDGTPFRKSVIGGTLDHASLKNATPLYAICPTALIFGIWDSTGPKKGLGAKFQRAIVSEIVGINVKYGRKTGSKIDPLQIQRDAGPVYRTNDGGWTLNASEALQEKNKPVLYAKSKKKNVTHDPNNDSFPDQGRPSVMNHGNVTPDFTRYKDNADSDDSLRPGKNVTKGAISVGGVTVDKAEQTTVLSLPALRRLHFPIAGGVTQEQTKIDQAGQVVLVALALTSAALAAEDGYDLRSRCLLWPAGPIAWELLDKPGEEPKQFTLDSVTAIQLLKDAVSEAEKAGLFWRHEPLELTPSPQLVQLVHRSQQITATEISED